MIKINCDIGEREKDHPVDLALMDHIHIANIACGGHAGDEETVHAFRTLAEKKRVAVSAHLSYPDRENFGRVSRVMDLEELIGSLDRQIALMPGVTLVKFHGGLYHDSCDRPELARNLAAWLKGKKIETVIAPHASEIRKACEDKGIDVLFEAFAERRYRFDPKTSRLGLMERTRAHSSIHVADEALRQCLVLIRYGFVEAYVDNGREEGETRKVTLPCKTLCIHSDSPIALELAENLGKTLRNERVLHD
jgi:UPF0271 protein